MRSAWPCSCSSRSGRPIFNDYWVNTILTQMFIFGIAAASLIFLSAYGAMTSLAQTALMGISAYLLGNMVTQGGAGGQSKGLTLGWDPTLALVLALVITTAIGVAFGAVAARSFGIYFLMLTLTYGVIANYFFGQVTQFGGFSPIAGRRRVHARVRRRDRRPSGQALLHRVRGGARRSTARSGI